MPVPKLIRSVRRPQLSKTQTKEVERQSYEQKLRQRASDLTAHERFDEAADTIRQIQSIARFAQPI